MGDFGVELHAVEAARLIRHAGNGARWGAGHDLKAAGQLGNFVAVAHPHFQHAVAFGRVEVLNILEQRRMAVRAHFGIAKFAGIAAGHLAAQLLRHGLHAVANAQHGQAQLEYGIRGAVIYLVHAGMAAREDDALERAIGRVLAHPVATYVAGVHFAVHVRLADAAGDELGNLGAKVEDEDFLMRHDGYCRRKS